MLLQYKEESNIDQVTLLLVDKLLNEKKFTIEEVGEILPVVFHTNSKKSILTYINHLGCNYFNLSLNELLCMGNDYAERFVHDIAIELNDNYIESRNTKLILTYLQPIEKLKDRVEWFISTKKLLSINQGQTINITYEWRFRKLMHQKLRSFLSIDDYYYRNHDVFSKLSRKEKQVISLLAQGYSNSDISHLLKNSLYTILDHRKNIYSKTGLKSYFELLKFAQAFDLF